VYACSQQLVLRFLPLPGDARERFTLTRNALHTMPLSVFVLPTQELTPLVHCVGFPERLDEFSFPFFLLYLVDCLGSNVKVRTILHYTLALRFDPNSPDVSREQVIRRKKGKMSNLLLGSL